MDTFWQIALNISMYLGEHWKEIVAYGGWMLGICSILQYLKRRYEIDKAKGFSFLGLWRMDGPRIMAAIYMLFTAASGLLTFFTNPANAIYFPDRFLFLFGIGYTIHRFMVSPASTKIENKMKPYIAALKQLQTMEERYAAIHDLTTAPAAPVQPTVTISPPPVEPPPVRPPTLVQ